MDLLGYTHHVYTLFFLKLTVSYRVLAFVRISRDVYLKTIEMMLWIRSGVATWIHDFLFSWQPFQHQLELASKALKMDNIITVSLQSSENEITSFLAPNQTIPMFNYGALISIHGAQRSWLFTSVPRDGDKNIQRHASNYFKVTRYIYIFYLSIEQVAYILQCMHTRVSWTIQVCFSRSSFQLV